MKKTEIKAGATYSTKTGNAARKALRIVAQDAPDAPPRPRYFGDASNAPGPNEPLVEYEQVRGARVGTREVIFLSQFATWAAMEDLGLSGNLARLREALAEAVILSHEAGKAGIEWRRKFKDVIDPA
jgi:hypothetical protein